MTKEHDPRDDRRGQTAVGGFVFFVTPTALRYSWIPSSGDIRPRDSLQKFLILLNTWFGGSTEISSRQMPLNF